MRSRCAGRIRVAAVLVAVGLAVALTSAPWPARADEKATEQARQHYAKGKQAFDLGKWDDAIAEFEEAYKLRSDPTFLFNMAQAYRRKGDLQRALDLYKNYLIENPQTPKRDDIEKRIRALEKEMKNPARRQIEAPAPVAQPSEPPPAAQVIVAPVPATVPAPVSVPTPTPAPAPAPAPESAPPTPAVSVVEPAQPAASFQPPSSGYGLRVAGIVCGAAGLASIGTAVYFYTRAASLSDRISSSDAPTSSDYQAGKDAETMQWVFYGVGAAALATGAVLYWLGSSSSAFAPTATVVAPMVGPGIAGLSAQGTFRCAAFQSSSVFSPWSQAAASIRIPRTENFPATRAVHPATFAGKVISAGSTVQTWTQAAAAALEVQALMPWSAVGEPAAVAARAALEVVGAEWAAQVVAAAAGVSARSPARAQAALVANQVSSRAAPAVSRLPGPVALVWPAAVQELGAMEQVAKAARSRLAVRPVQAARQRPAA
jgi:hypothetical protein